MQERSRRAEDTTGRTITTAAVLAVAIVGVVAAVMVKRGESETARVQAAAPMALPVQPVAPSQELVKAPPLKAGGGLAMGGAAACANCGTVELVVAMHDKPNAKKASRYQMHIRMDDGKLRSVEQRGALAPGSRVVVEGEQVRALPAPG